jgi:hypothetical protein
MSPYRSASRAVAVAMLFAVSAAQLMPLPCMIPSVTEGEPAAVASHEHHHGSSEPSTPLEDHTPPTDRSHAGQSDCTMMLSCVIVMTLAQSVPAEVVLELSADSRPSSSVSHVEPLLSHLTPPPKTA